MMLTGETAVIIRFPIERPGIHVSVIASAKEEMWLTQKVDIKDYSVLMYDGS